MENLSPIEQFNEPETKISKDDNLEKTKERWVKIIRKECLKFSEGKSSDKHFALIHAENLDEEDFVLCKKFDEKTLTEDEARNRLGYLRRKLEKAKEDIYENDSENLAALLLNKLIVENVKKRIAEGDLKIH